MAGIFSEIDSDIKKLRQLKEEIEKVKNSLKSINVNVDINIAKDLEEQLKYITTQYNTLVQKVAEAEGKITLSTKRINDASEKIIKAQNQLSKSTSINQQSKNSNSSTTANNAETGSIQTQAKAYDELASEIDAVMGTRAQNIKRLIEEQNATRLINEEIKKLTKYQSSNSNLSSAQQKRLEQLNNSLLTHKTALSEIRQVLMNNVKIDNAAATSMDALSQSLGRMRTTYRQLTEDERNSTFGKELLSSINQADARIKTLDATIGNHQRNIGNYSSGWNGLSMSIQQVGRELPSLAVGWNTFFLAISNNLPILADELKRARVQYEALKASGQNAVPVWKQVISSIFSWQTALVAGITLLTLYGDKVVDWVASLFKAENTVDEMTIRMQNLSRVMSEGAKQSAAERVELDTLYKATQDHTRSLKERNKAADELQRKYPSYFGNLSNEAILAGKASDAYKNLTDNILKAAQARAAMKIIEENYNKIYQLQKAINADTNWTNRNREKTKGGKATITNVIGSPTTGGAVTTTTYTKEAAEFNRRIKALEKNKKAVEDLEKANNALAKSIDITSMISNDKEKGTENIDIYADQLYRLAELRSKGSKERIQLEVNLENQVEQARIDSMKDGFEKQQAQRKLNNKKELQTLEKQKEDYISKIVDIQKQIFEAEENAKASKNKNYKKQIFDSSSVSVDTSNFDELIGLLPQKQQAEALKAERDAMNQYLKEYGTFMEKKEAIIKEYNDKIAEAATEGDRKILQKQMEENLKNLNFDEFKLSINFADVFGNLDAQATDALRKLRDKLKEYINSAAKDLGPEDLKELQDAFNNIDLKISERDPFGEFKNSLSSYKSAQKDVKKAQEDLNTVMKGGEIITGGYIDETGKFVTKLLSQEQAEKNLEKAQSSRQKTLEGLTATINAMGNTGMEVVNSGNQVIDMLETFGVEVSDSVKTTLDGVGQIMSGMASIDLTKPMSIITGSITMLTGLGKAIAGIFGVGNKDKKLEKEIQSLQSQVEDLQDAYDKLDKAIAKAYSNSAADLIRDQETVLKQQKALVEQKIAKELDKKKTDDDKVDEYRKQLDAINESLGSIEDRVIEAIMGTSVQEAIDQFADAYVNAWSQGEDAAMNAKNVVANILKQSITQSVKDYLKNPVNELMNYLQGAVSDGLDEAEKNAIAERIKLMTSGVKGIGDVWAPLFEEIERIQQPDKGGFETMSQDTATELNGRFTALQYAGEVVAAQSKEQTAILNQVFNVNTQHLNIADEIRNSLINSYFDLVTIRDNTTNTVKRLDDTNKKLDMVNDNLRKLWK